MLQYFWRVDKLPNNFYFDQSKSTPLMKTIYMKNQFTFGPRDNNYQDKFAWSSIGHKFANRNTFSNRFLSS